MRTRKPNDIATPSEDKISRDTERLWALKKEQAKADRASGVEAGVEWAMMETGVWQEVWAVAALDRPNRNFKGLSTLLVNHFGYDGDDFMSFLPEHSGRPMMNGNAIEGFIEGVEEVKHGILIDGLYTDEDDELLKEFQKKREKKEKKNGQEKK
jgi:hypothetical protein